MAPSQSSLTGTNTRGMTLTSAPETLQGLTLLGRAFLAAMSLPFAFPANKLWILYLLRALTSPGTSITARRIGPTYTTGRDTSTSVRSLQWNDGSQTSATLTLAANIMAAIVDRRDSHIHDPLLLDIFLDLGQPRSAAARQLTDRQIVPKGQLSSAKDSFLGADEVTNSYRESKLFFLRIPRTSHFALLLNVHTGYNPQDLLWKPFTEIENVAYFGPLYQIDDLLEFEA